MKKLYAIILFLLIQPIQSSDHLPQFSSFMWGATTTALVTGAIWYNNSLKKSKATPIIQSPQIDPAFIIDKKSKAVTQDKSYLLTPYINGILTSGNIDVRVLEGTSKNQITIMSNEYYIGKIETYMGGNTLKLSFNDNNSLHKPVINIFLMGNLPEYYSYDTSRLEICMDSSANRIATKLELFAYGESFLSYQSIGSSEENKLYAYEKSILYVTQKCPSWKTSFDRSASLYIDNVMQEH